MRRLILAWTALTLLAGAAAATLNHSEGRLLCQDGTPIVGCKVTLTFHDSSGAVVTTSTSTSSTGDFIDTLNCAASNQQQESMVLTADCCQQSWTISTAACAGNFGTFVCENCGGAGCANPPRGLVAWWPLDEATGPQAVEVAGRNHGTYVGGPTAVAGTVGNALSFDGTGDEVEVADAPALDFGALPGGDFSVDFWLRTDQTLGFAPLLDKRGGGAHPRGYAVFLSSGRLALQLAEGARVPATPRPPRVARTTTPGSRWPTGNGTSSP